MKPIKVKVSKRNITVHVMTLAMSLHEQRLLQLVIANPSDNVDVQTVRTVFYPTLTACSTGDVPTEDEFLALTAKEIDGWYEAAGKVNPDILEDPEPKTEEDAEEDLKKK